jgi:hypothetical protein
MLCGVTFQTQGTKIKFIACSLMLWLLSATKHPMVKRSRRFPQDWLMSSASKRFGGRASEQEKVGSLLQLTDLQLLPTTTVAAESCLRRGL